MLLLRVSHLWVRHFCDTKVLVSELIGVLALRALRLEVLKKFKGRKIEMGSKGTVNY